MWHNSHGNGAISEPIAIKRGYPVPCSRGSRGSSAADLVRGSAPGSAADCGEVADVAELAYGWDAAFCPDPVPVEAGGFRMSYGGFYIGGSSAFHVWDQAERARLGLSGQKAMPIWVPTPGHENPRQVGLEAAAALRAAGIPAGARPWRVLMWDLETGVEPDASWLQLAANALESRGYGSIVYGSVVGSGLFTYPPRTGYLVAFPNGRPSLYPHPDVVGTQFQFSVTVPGGEVDLDVVEASLLDHLGVLSY